MEPKEQRDAREKAEAAMRKQRQATCKAAHFEVVEGEIDQKALKFEYEIENHGCKNLRRNGSAWCQACSDAYHQKQS